MHSAGSADRTVAHRPWLALLAAVGLAVLLRVEVVEPVRVPSGSMAPTVRAGDHVLIEKVSRHLGAPERGELVAFRQPGSGALTLKRVAAVAGDEVGVEDGRLVVNGRPVAESYVDYSRVDGEYFGPVAVPAGNVFVLGDNRGDSVDSRRFGPVPLASLVGTVLLSFRRS